MTGNVTYEAPGDGPWELDASHFDRPFPRYGVDWWIEGFERGQAKWFERLGIPMKGLTVALVNGMPYGQPIPLVGKPADLAKPPPPAWIMKVMMWLHPAMRRRAKNAERWFAQKGWREDFRLWDEEVKPALLKRFAALEAEPIEQLDDAAMVEHLRRCGEAVRDNFIAHFDTNAMVVPIGGYLRRAHEWTGASIVELLESLAGSGASDDLNVALDQLAEALRGVDDGPELLNGGRAPAQALAPLRERDDELGAAARQWLSLVEHRMVSAGDFATPIGREVPEVLIRQVRGALDGSPRGRSPSVASDAILDRAPPEHREELAWWLGEARRVNRGRDERSTLCDAWVMGLARRALLEVGRRLEDRGRLRDAHHVVDLEHAEVEALMSGASEPSAEEVAARTAHRESLSIDDAPLYLGVDTAPPDPPLEAFGGALGEIMKALFFVMEHMERDAEPTDAPAELVRGLPASRGTYRGPARVIGGPDDFGRVEHGDVLVVRATMPAYNVLLPVVGAIVTDRGGALCHAAIVSREYGLPCVVGTREATKRIPDGALVEVDGDAGTVTLVE